MTFDFLENDFEHLAPVCIILWQYRSILDVVEAVLWSVEAFLNNGTAKYLFPAFGDCPEVRIPA
jgi:hypothetical protein